MHTHINAHTYRNSTASEVAVAAVTAAAAPAEKGLPVVSHRLRMQTTYAHRCSH